MRDAHRMKERIDVSLDNRQIVGGALGSLVILAGVFILGVVVGKKMSSDKSFSDAPDILSALDARATALYEAKREPSDLTFHEELTRKNTEPLPPPTMIGLADAGRAIENEAAALLARGPEVKEPTALGEIKKTNSLPTRTIEGAGVLKRAFQKVSDSNEEAKEGAFTLQLTASQDKEEAMRYVVRLKNQGYAPYLLAAEVPGRGTWYRVRLGSFSSKETANSFMEHFRRDTQLQAFVTSKQ